jgi:anti-anti-sigma factor
VASDIPALMRALARSLQGVDLGAGTLEERLDDLVDTAARLFAVDGAGLMLVDADGRLRSAGASDDAAEALERAQEHAGDGPGVVATRDRKVVAVEDLSRDDRWPALWTELERHRVRSVLSAPIWVRGRPAGNLNLLGREPRPWSLEERDGIAAYAGAATAMLRIALEAQHADDLVRRLRDGLAGRTEGGGREAARSHARSLAGAPSPGSPEAWRQPFACEVSRAAGVAHIRPVGELDMATIDVLDRRLRDATSAGARELVLALADVTFMDSTGLRLLLRWHEAAAADGFALALLPGPPAVQRVVSIAGLDEHLPFRASPVGERP